MKKFGLLTALVALTIFAAGCPNNSTTPAGNTDAGTNAHAGDDHSGHDHAAHSDTGSHGGHIIELGHDHEYHAELVDDHETDTITVYMMDGDMKPLPIEQSSVTLILTAGDDSQTYELPAVEGSSSEFSSNDENLMKMIDTESVSGKLRVTIDDKPFSGSFDHHAHEHDHEH